MTRQGAVRPWGQTPSQTAGPFVLLGLTPTPAAVPDRQGGPAITVTGRVFAGPEGADPVIDAMLEFWHAAPDGTYPDGLGARYGPGGFHRVACDFTTGGWRLETVKPGAIRNGAGGAMPPHMAVTVLARGVNTPLITRLYFAEDEPLGEAWRGRDPVLETIGDRDLAGRLIAQRVAPDAQGRACYQLDIALQGPRQTPFLDFVPAAGPLTSP